MPLESQPCIPAYLPYRSSAAVFIGSFQRTNNTSYPLDVHYNNPTIREYELKARLPKSRVLDNFGDEI